MNRAIRVSCLIALPLALAACGDKEPEAGAMAEGEILPGSISDSMLPLDTVRSQPPLAPRTSAAKAGDRSAASEAGAEAADAASATADAAATPAAPSPAAPPAPSPAAPAATQ